MSGNFLLSGLYPDQRRRVLSGRESRQRGKGHCQDAVCTPKVLQFRQATDSQAATLTSGESVMAERLVKVRTFQTSDGLVSMWGTLHFNAHGGTVAGWLCDSWTESGTPYPDVLRPRLHWLS